jgi:subtilisin family serine protease
VNPRDYVGLTALTEVTGGTPGVTVAVIDGPVALDHAAFAGQRIREVPGGPASACATGASAAHSTFMAGMLAARRDSENRRPALHPVSGSETRRVFLDNADAVIEENFV